ncbi:MAG: selenide, water dikinase SelD [Bacteroidetes bacterium]|nr:MAG: selenide, water dikinase SelD [Bacteroidota bacterium]
MSTPENIRLTQYSHGAGCGCKISPSVLESILFSEQKELPHPDLLVGNDTRDDAAVYDLGDGTAVISTTDFFMPIVDDAYDFGRIASVNAISDIYAMGGTPMMAIAILGWPVDKLPPSVAQRVMEGSRAVCREVGIPLAGGHSIDSPEPIFGLAVTGRVNVGNLKKNSTALAGNKLFLTKPLGVGILTTAQKKGILKEEHSLLARDTMVKLNKVGEIFARYAYVRAMTDVTGFGLLGHLSEMCEGSRVSAVIHSGEVPVLEPVAEYIAQGSLPGGTKRNFESYGHKINELSDYQRAILCDPQTSGGLLVAVVGEYENEFAQLARSLGIDVQSFGYLTEREERLITVK